MHAVSHRRKHFEKKKKKKYTFKKNSINNVLAMLESLLMISVRREQIHEDPLPMPPLHLYLHLQPTYIIKEKKIIIIFYLKREFDKQLVELKETIAYYVISE